MMQPEISSAATAKDKYIKAEVSYNKLLKSRKKLKYRDNWLSCIKKFQAVYRHDPSGPWAAAGLYMSGKLYQELYKLSYKKSDKKEALDIFERIIKRFPKSSYKYKASKAIRAFSREKKHKAATGKAGYGKKITAKDKYIKAEAGYNKLLKSRKKLKYRDNWLSCIEKFQAVYRHDPSGPWAAAGLYMSGKLYRELYKLSYKKSDKKEALDLFERIIKRFPKSRYKNKAEKALYVFSPSHVQKIASKDKDYNKERRIQKNVKSTGKSISTVTGLRYWSNPSYTRIVIDVDREASYIHRLLKKDPSIHKPQRLYVDLQNSILGDETKKSTPINDNLLSNARAGQYTSGSVRVVIDIKSFKNYKIFSLRNPFRIVIDVWGKEKKATQVAGSKLITAKPGAKITTTSALAKQLALGVNRIVIDPGHGGRDYGAPGYLRGVHEKNIVLKIAKKLAKKIRKELGCEVIMTRNSDRYLTLEERTAIANTKNADLFVSIHTNAARDRRAYGIETYFLNLATDNEAILVAARENATSTKNISDLETILSDLMQNAKINESSSLAYHVQKSLYKHMKKKYSRIKNKGVKQAPFYVLLGAQMPSILIETSFISNSRECKRLNNAKYQNHLCNAIVNGIRGYIKETNPTAMIR
ncbi:MAG: N-acetylmuramoyl-L-alanine amidase [Desulfobacteraceae bacterium Eth-SRB1]|nr:MAG: N-acetylmuramoyl-L-alanine amidase [Desulfobacteraceae bacterium Eth-SRB1]